VFDLPNPDDPTHRDNLPLRRFNELFAILLNLTDLVRSGVSMADVNTDRTIKLFSGAIQEWRNPRRGMPVHPVIPIDRNRFFFANFPKLYRPRFVYISSDSHFAELLKKPESQLKTGSECGQHNQLIYNTLIEKATIIDFLFFEHPQSVCMFNDRAVSHTFCERMSRMWPRECDFRNLLLDMWLNQDLKTIINTVKSVQKQRGSLAYSFCHNSIVVENPNHFKELRE
jgi:hypothetical protein